MSSNNNAEWGRSGAPGSAFTTASNRGRGRGSSRGGRGGGRGGGGTARGGGSKRDIPSVVVPPPPPPESPATGIPAASKPQNRRKRSQTPRSPASRPPALDDSLLKPQKQRSRGPHSAPPTRDPPPHLANHFDIRTDIDALVERVRAVAMADNNRPTTPGSHIDWAGDEDDTLPDLDDWGVKTAPKPKESVELISPIIVDGLKALPDPVIKSSTSSAEVSPSMPPTHPFLNTETQPGSLSVLGSSTQSTEPRPIHPLPPKPAFTQQPTGAKSKQAHQAPEPSAADSGPKIVVVQSATSNVETLEPAINLPQKPISAPSDMTSYSNHPFTHNRSQTLGRPETGFIPRFSRSGASTPRGGGGANNHNRTHSTPPAFNTHRTPHSRPVLTGDAISRLTKTINAGLSPSSSRIAVATAGKD